MPGERRCGQILGVGEGLETLSEDLFIDRENEVRGFRDKVCHREQLVGVRVHKCLDPCSRTLILDLYNVGESGRVVGLYEKLERCGVSVVGTIECLLCCSDRVAEGHGRSLVRRARKLDERRAE